MARWGMTAVGVLVVALVFVGRGGAQGEQDLAAQVADLQTRVASIEARFASQPVGTAEATGTSFEGTGNSVSEPFPLRAGHLLAFVEPEPGSIMSLGLYAADGSAVPLVASGSGIVTLLNDGEYRLGVASNGAWRVVLSQE